MLPPPKPEPTDTLAVWTTDSKCTWSGSALHVRVGLTHAGRELFAPSDFSLTSGTITGLVGTNGCGKTSLAKVLPHLPGFPSSEEWTVEYLSSEDAKDTVVAGDDAFALTTVEYLRASVEKRLEGIRQKIQDLENADDDQDVEHVANQLSDLYELEEKITTMAEREIQVSLQMLGFLPHQHKPLLQLSSGWRYKCRLVASFLARPRLFIIDEPSFLDSASTLWLIERLQELVRESEESPSTTSMVLLISHKESLLDELCDRILYINAETKRIHLYNTRYQEFREELEAQRSRADKVSNDARKEEAHATHSLQNLQKQLHRREHNLKSTTSQNADQRFIKGKNKEAKQKADRSAASKVKQLQKQTAAAEELLLQAQRERIKPLHIKGTVLDGGILATFQEVSFRYAADEEPIFEYVDLQLQPRDRVLLTGPNGCGKSTLVKLILGKLEPTTGNIVRKGNALYFPQDALNDLTRNHGHESALSFLGNNLAETEARIHLGSFGLAKDLALRPIHTLSAGQRVRLWLSHANLRNSKPTLLILDEITENVDRETRQSLLDMLHSFTGAVLVISHDEDFCELFQAQQVWRLTPKGISVHFPDDS